MFTTFTRYHIFGYSLITACACGLGVLPFFFLNNISKQGIGIAKGIAAGLMIAASFAMINQGISYSVWGVFRGIFAGMIMIIFATGYVQKHEKTFHFGNIHGKSAGQLILFLVVMTIHSLAEGIAMGFAFGPSLSLGLLVSLVMAIHNIPEGLAIASIMIPKGVSPGKATLRAIFSSLPQPVIAVPAFLFVSMFQLLLPYGLGFAAGAMLWMSFGELLPEAIHDTPSETIATIVTMSITVIILLEQVLKLG